MKNILSSKFSSTAPVLASIPENCAYVPDSRI